MQPIQVKDDAMAAQRFRILSAAVQDNYQHLYASALAVIVKRNKGMKQPQVIELVEEVVQEAISRALAKAVEFDPSRRAVPWLMQFILNVLMETTRQINRQPRQSDFSDFTWNGLLASLHCQGPSGEFNDRLSQLDQVLKTLSVEQQTILTLRFKNGLDGQALAQAVGAGSPGAARVRLCRALAALREGFSRSTDQEEVNP